MCEQGIMQKEIAVIKGPLVYMMVLRMQLRQISLR